MIRALIAVLALLMLLPAHAYGHGALLRSTPADGDSLTSVPRELRLTFTEDVVLPFARLTLAGPRGPVELAELRLAPDSARVLIGVIRGELVAGPYTVEWQVASEDGHPVRGTYSFAIASDARGLPADVAGPVAPGQAPPPAEHHPSAPSGAESAFDAEAPAYVAIRWLTFLGLLGVVGVIAFRLVLWLVQRQDPLLARSLLIPASTRAAWLGIGMAALVGGAAVLRLYAQSYALHGPTDALEPERIGTMLTRTLWGWGWLLQAVATVVVLAGLARVVRRADRMDEHAEALVAQPEEALHRVPENGEAEAPYDAGPDAPTRDGEPYRSPAPEHGGGEEFVTHAPGPAQAGAGWALAAVGAAALAFTPAMSGHAASTSTLAPLPILADALHVMSAGGWLGGLLVLIVIGVPSALRLGAHRRGSAVAALVNAFSPTALAFAALLVATGVFAAWLQLGAVTDLWQTRYGRVLLLKLAVLPIVFGTGAYNWRRVRPALGSEAAAGRLRRSATLELAVGAVVLAVTAVLVATASPAGMAPTPEEASSGPSASAPAG